MKARELKQKTARSRMSHLRPAGVKRSPAVHVAPEAFAALRRDAKTSGAPTLSGYVAASLQFCRGKLTWLPDGRVRVRT